MKKKTLLIVLVAAIFVVMFSLTNSVKAASGDTTVTKIEALTGGTFGKENTSTNPTSPVTLTLTADEVKKLQWVSESDPTGEDGLKRPSSGWWIGFKLTFSEDVSQAGKKVSCEYTDYTGKVNEPSEINLDQGKNTEYTSWLGINMNKVMGKTGETTIGKLKYTNESGLDFTVIVKVKDPDKVVLNPDTDRAIAVTVNGHVFTMLKNKSLKEGLTASEMEDLEKIMTPAKGYKFVGLFKKGTTEEVTIEDELSETVELEAKFEKLPEAPKAEAEEDEKEPTPNTGVENVYAVAGLVAVVTLAGAIVLNKRK